VLTYAYSMHICTTLDFIWIGFG